MFNTHCSFCNNPLYKKPSQLKLYSEHFCNRECQQNKSKQDNPLVVKSCDNCGVEVKKSRNQLRSSKNGLCFCGNKCKNIFISKDNKKDNPKSYKDKKIEILERANNSCVSCNYGEDVRMLDIHHIDHNHQNNNDENLAVLCVWCHAAHHRGVKQFMPS